MANATTAMAARTSQETSGGVNLRTTGPVRQPHDSFPVIVSGWYLIPAIIDSAFSGRENIIDHIRRQILRILRHTRWKRAIFLASSVPHALNAAAWCSTTPRLLPYASWSAMAGC